MMTDNEVLEFLNTHGVEVHEFSENVYEIGGFYKSGSVTLDLNTRVITARYNEQTVIPEWSNILQELVWLNNKWHQRSKDHFDGWYEVDSGWSRVMEDFENFSN